MKNGQRNRMKRMGIAVVCIGMIGSGGLVQAMNTAKPLRTGKVMPEMRALLDVPASKIKKMPLGENDQITPVTLPDFQVGKAEVTGALWSDVYNWAIQNGYRFANTGGNVGTDKPVTGVSWYDAIVWANAYTEFTNKQWSTKLVPVYQSKGLLGFNQQVLKDATDENALNEAKVVLSKEKKKRGFQLLTEMQWELVARWNGTKKPTKGSLAKEAISTEGKDGRLYYWTPGDYAIGANENMENRKETARVAWYGQTSAKTVCTKSTNVLGICDMSGNVWEWLFTSPYNFPEYRVIRGGSWRSTDINIVVSYSGEKSFDGRIPRNNRRDSGFGFRVARMDCICR